LDAIKKAAYRISDRASCEITNDERVVTCTLRLLAPSSEEDAVRIADLFRIEVLDQDLRSSIASETAALRNAVLAYAFSRADIARE